MPKIMIESHGETAILRLNNGVTNAISPDLIDDLSEKLITVEKDFQGVILAGGEKFFCIGFDLPALLILDRDEMTDFFNKFNHLLLHLFTLPLPTCCSISGHAIAGGNILALTCDYRYAASGENLIGLNEIKLGVPVPYLADLILRQIVGDRTATEILYGGEFMTTTDAKQLGLVDEIFPQTDVEGQALETVTELAARPQAAFSEIKANRVEKIRQRYGENCMQKNEKFLDCWFSEPVQGLLKEASQKF
jgi:enoyl-CoA hydratase/carnithine racemase